MLESDQICYCVLIAHSILVYQYSSLQVFQLDSINLLTYSSFLELRTTSLSCPVEKKLPKTKKAIQRVKNLVEGLFNLKKISLIGS